MRWRLIALVAAVVMILAACGGDDDSDGASSGGSDSTAAGNAESGQVWYDGTCSTCHGQAGVGIEGLGCYGGTSYETLPVNDHSGEATSRLPE